MRGQVLVEVSATGGVWCFEVPNDAIFKRATYFDRQGDLIFITQANGACPRCG